MGHKFDPSHRSKLENAERYRAMPPEDTLRDLGLKEGDVMADVGCGPGFFTVPAAAVVGPAGKVYARDVSQAMIDRLTERLSEAAADNIDAARSDEADLKLETGTIDFVLLSTVLHEAEDLRDFLGEVVRVLKPQGRIGVIEWKKEAMDDGPPLEHRLGWEDLRPVLRETGFEKLATAEIGGRYYSVTGRLGADIQ